MRLGHKGSLFKTWHGDSLSRIEILVDKTYNYVFEGRLILNTYHKQDVDINRHRTVLLRSSIIHLFRPLEMFVKKQGLM